MRGSQNLTYLSPDRVAQGPIHFKEETVSLCHPERSEGSLAGQRSFAALRMTILHRLRLTRKTSYLKCIGPCGCQVCRPLNPARLASARTIHTPPKNLRAS